MSDSKHCVLDLTNEVKLANQCICILQDYKHSQEAEYLIREYDLCCGELPMMLACKLKFPKSEYNDLINHIIQIFMVHDSVWRKLLNEKKDKAKKVFSLILDPIMDKLMNGGIAANSFPRTVIFPKNFRK